MIIFHVELLVFLVCHGASPITNFRIFLSSSYTYSIFSDIFFTIKIPSPPISRSFAESVISGSGASKGS